MKDFISFVIPVYNEKESIKQVIDEIYQIGEKSSKRFEIIVVNDASDDGTELILKEIKGIKVINHNVNRGYGAALKTGIRYVEGNWIAIIDADSTYPAYKFLDLFTQMEEADMVIAIRTGKKVSIPFFRRPAKWIFKRFSNILTGQSIPDINSGMRIFKKEIVVRFLKLFPDRFSFTTTLSIAAACNNYNIKYMPIDYFKRKGKSTIHPVKDFFGFIQLITRLGVYFRPLNFFVPISIFFFTIGLAKMIIDVVRLSHFGIGGVALVLMGMQILFLGLLADLIIKRTNL